LFVFFFAERFLKLWRMEGNLFIVESPHKAGQIQGFLGTDDFKVVSSKGHIRDLEENGMSIDIEHGFEPKYVIPSDKKALVASMKKQAAAAGTVWLASDPDREGEAISWHLAQALELDPAKIRRVTYNEVTKSAVLEAMKHPRDIDMNLVNAQQARRVLDRLVGFELSPILWRKIRRGLSAGRVQSVTLRLVVDREREIAAFKSHPYYSVSGRFVLAGQTVKGMLDTKFQTVEEARKFLEDISGSSFAVKSIDKKEGKRFPAPPFTTSTLQQEAARKLHFTSSKTMRIAQTLYEKGLITYMRTDSTNLSSMAIAVAKDYVIGNFGEQYSHPRNFKTKSRGAQEAHEAIRPTFFGTVGISGTPDEQKLYSLIWKRAIASQMEEAKVLNTTIRIVSDKRPEAFEIQSSEILFDGFLRMYFEGVDDQQEDEGNVFLPAINPGDRAGYETVSAECKYTQAPYRYSEQTLIKKMEELGIGRPSTYAPTITTLTSGRGYIVTADKEGVAMPVENLTLKGDRISESKGMEKVGAEKKKLIPTDVGIQVTDYLTENFPAVLNYDFTANVEEDFDKIAEGEKAWTEVIGEFYNPFHEKVGEAISNREYSRVERTLGVDPKDGKTIMAKLGQYGPFVQKGEGDDKVFASLGKGQIIETITLEEAILLFQLPRVVGEYKGVPVIAQKGRFGPFLKYDGANFSLPRGVDPISVSLEQCIQIIEAAANKPAANAVILEFTDSDIQIINGRYGPYIKHAGSNYKIPKGQEAASLTEEQCKSIIENEAPTSKGRKRFPRPAKK